MSQENMKHAARQLAEGVSGKNLGDVAGEREGSVADQQVMRPFLF